MLPWGGVPTKGLLIWMAGTFRLRHSTDRYGHTVGQVWVGYRQVPDDKLDETALEIARQIAAAPAFTLKMFRRALSRLASPAVRQSIAEEALTQSMVFASYDYAEMENARAEQREPKYRGH